MTTGDELRQHCTCVLCRVLWLRVPHSPQSSLGFERLALSLMSLLPTFLVPLPLFLRLFAAGGGRHLVDAALRGRHFRNDARLRPRHRRVVRDVLRHGVCPCRLQRRRNDDGRTSTLCIATLLLLRLAVAACRQSPLGLVLGSIRLLGPRAIILDRAAAVRFALDVSCVALLFGLLFAPLFALGVLLET